MKTVTFFNNKGGVGKTTLVHHMAWMFHDLGLRVLAVDLDPQANLSAAFLPESSIEELWDDQKTIFGAVRPLLERIGDVACPYCMPISDRLHLVVGALELSNFEDEISKNWSECAVGKVAAFRVETAFGRAIHLAAKAVDADIALIDIGPNLGAINRAVMIASDHVVLPLAPDLYSLRGLQNLGPTLEGWRRAWTEFRGKVDPAWDFFIPEGRMSPVGYVVLQHATRLDRPVKAYERWIARIPGTYRSAVLGDPTKSSDTTTNDKNCLAMLRHYRSLMPMAQESRKPVFRLTAADGAIGGHAQYVRSAYSDFHSLASRIASRVEIATVDDLL